MLQVQENTDIRTYDRNGWRLYADGLKTAALDIETTGLSSSRDHLILAGSLKLNSPCILRQTLAASPAEEPDLLAGYLAEMAEADIWVSYNGDTFDLPFLSRRLVKRGMGTSLPLHLSLDLYRLFRRYCPMASLLPNLKQTTLEHAMGLSAQRRDAISGSESAKLYEEYLRTGDQGLERKILLHNHDDLLMLSRLMIVLDKMDLHRIMFQRGFMIGWDRQRLLAEEITLGKNFLRVTGRSKNVTGDYDVFYENYQWTHRFKERRFSLTLPCIYEKNLTFLDLDAYAMDFSDLEKYPGFINGYLLLHDGRNPAFQEVNHMIKIILTEILKKIGKSF